MLALQRLGYACGQSAMCADLAAFVAHKQARCGGSTSRRDERAGLVMAGAAAAAAGAATDELDDEAVEAGSSSDGGSDAGVDTGSGRNSSLGSGGWLRSVGRTGVSSFASAAAPEQWRALPDTMRIKLLLLTCFSRIAACYSATGRPPPSTPVNLLVSELLVPEADMQTLCRAAARAKPPGRSRSPQPPPASQPGDAAAASVAAMRRLSMGVVAAFGMLAGVSHDSRGDSRGDDTLMLDVRPKQHDDVVAQLRHRLARLIGQEKDALRGACVRAACFGGF